jgi:hypothetical protein
MGARLGSGFMLIGVLASLGASYPTTNFLVEAPTPQMAQQIGQAAEYYRKQKAIDWLGYEMPPWPERCPLRVHVTMGMPGGATSFAFDRGHVLGQRMDIEGPADRLLNSVLPHEVTHTVFAYRFRRPVPRWADEGGSVLSEDEVEKDRHDRLVRQILNTPGRRIPLRRLFSLHEYPGDVMVLYAEGFSVANFLVASSNRQTFLAFIEQGMSQNGWDYAVRAYYPSYQSVEQLEEAWLAHLRATKRMPIQLAQNQVAPVTADPAHRVTVRQTVPPLILPAPVFRAQADQEGDRPESYPQGTPVARQGYLPDYNGTPQPPAPAIPGGNVPQDGWQAPGAAPYQPPIVQLGPPRPIPVQSPNTFGRPVQGNPSPVGYPR